MHRGGESVKVRGRYRVRSTMAMPISRPAWPGWARFGYRATGPGSTWRANELVPLFDDWRLDPMPLSLAFPPNRHVSAKLRVFIDWIAGLIAQHAPVIGPGNESSTNGT